MPATLSRSVRCFARLVLGPSLAAALVACGGRSSLDGASDPAADGNSAAQDGGAGGDGAEASDALTASGDGEERADTTDAVDTGVAATDGENPIAFCGGCIARSCGNEIIACVIDANCRVALNCLAVKCVAGGGGALDPACFAGCSSNFPAATLTQVVGVASCLAGRCGPDCIALAGALTPIGR